MLRGHIDEAAGVIEAVPGMLRERPLTLGPGKPEHDGNEIWKDTHLLARVIKGVSNEQHAMLA